MRLFQNATKIKFYFIKEIKFCEISYETLAGDNIECTIFTGLHIHDNGYRAHVTPASNINRLLMHSAVNNRSQAYITDTILETMFLVDYIRFLLTFLF